MKIITFFQKMFFSKKTNHLQNSKGEVGFYDLSSKERIKIMRSAGRGAQREQQLLLRKFQAVYNRA